MRDRRTSSISQLFSKTLESINKNSSSKKSFSRNRNNMNNLSPASSGYGSSTGSSKSFCSSGKRIMLQQNSGRFFIEIKEEIKNSEIFENHKRRRNSSSHQPHEAVHDSADSGRYFQPFFSLKFCQITNQIAILQKKKSWYQCSTEYESDISEGSDSEFEFYKARFDFRS